MLRRVKNIVVGSTPVEFESLFGISDSVERLRSVTGRSVLSVLTKQEAVGTVGPSHVSLQRVIPMMGNFFKPFFQGRFIEMNGRVILAGRFTMHWFAKVSTALWFGSAICGAIVGHLQLVADPGTSWDMTRFWLEMLATGAALLWVGIWFGRNDDAWLSNVIARALADPGFDNTAASEHSDSTSALTRGRPIAITVAVAVFGLFGVIIAGFAIFGMQSEPTAPLITHHFPYINVYLLSAIWASFLLVLTCGVYRRRLLAWRAGLVLFAITLVYPIADVLNRDTLPMGRSLTLTIVIGACLGNLMWWRWWHAQRIHFRE